jgi:glycoprotein endo-alpha-1,2-mannosidase
MERTDDQILNYNIHIFYYPWYGNPEHDNGSYLHWNHEYLPHWNPVEAQKWQKGT